MHVQFSSHRGDSGSRAVVHNVVSAFHFLQLYFEVFKNHFKQPKNIMHKSLNFVVAIELSYSASVHFACKNSRHALA